MQWLTELIACGKPAVLVTVASAEGSAPRAAGAKMLVTPERQFDTIGGGHLEHCALEFARAMLADPGDELRSQRQLERFPLGPTLGQCCGGVVYLAFERIDDAAAGLFAELQWRLQQGQDSWRAVPLDAAEPSTLQLPGMRGEFDLKPGCRLQRDQGGKRWLIDACLPHRSHLFLFGAGHVGAALVQTLAHLPCRVTWIDEREGMFPAGLPGNVICELSDAPERFIGSGPAGASFLVMTHSHPLDQRLAEAILQRADVGWFGLIGSRTKRIQFERRLRARGISPQRLAEMVCPIGIPGIKGKQPATIALSVAAQLMQVWEAQQAASGQRDDLSCSESAG